MGLDALNELEYQATIKKTGKGNQTLARNASIRLTQDEKLIATATSFWNLAQFQDKATYVLKDSENAIIGIAKAYIKKSEPYTLSFDLQDAYGYTIGTMIIFYDKELVENSGITLPVRAVLFSKEGLPLIEDQKLNYSFYRHLDLYIPGTNDKMSEIQCNSLFWTDKWNLKISDLSYAAQMNITPELFFFYYAIRSDYYNYTYRDIENINTRK
jgi:hypothetical protein